MTYSLSDVVTLIASIGVLVTALGAVIVNIIVAVRTGKKVEESLEVSKGISNRVEEVHTSTNSNLSAVKAELEKSNAALKEMTVLVADLKSERDKLATITALNTDLNHKEQK